MATSFEEATGSRCIYLSITKLSTGDRDLMLQFTDGVSGSSEYSVADFYVVYWQCKRGGVWRDGDTNSVTNLRDFYTPPNDATEVRARVRAIAKTYRDDNNNEHYYYEENPSSFKNYKFNGNKPVLSTYSVSNVTLGLQNGGESTLYANWTWGKGSETDHFEIDWDYSTSSSIGNNSWYEGSSSDNVAASTRQASYNIPSNARRVRFRIRPIAKRHIETYIGGQYDTLYWNSEWTTFYWVYAGTVTPSVKRNISQVSLSIELGTDSNLIARWHWDYQSQTDHFNYEFKYSTSNNTWYDGSSGTFEPSVRQTSYSIPSNAKRVRFAIRPIARSFTENFTEDDNIFGIRTNSYYTSSSVYYFWGESGSVAPTQTRKVQTVSVRKEQGTDSTVYSTWQWDYQSQTDHFDIQWKYSTSSSGNRWFDGSSATVAANVRISSYNFPSNAKRVRFLVRPVSKNVTETYNDPENTFGRRTTKYWTGEWSEPYYFINGGYVAPTVSKSVTSIQLGLQTGTDSTLVATWPWLFQAQTEKFKIEWKYDTGDGFWYDGTTSDVNNDIRQATYNMPSNARRVRFRIMPVSNRYTTTTSTSDSYGTAETAYWNGQWSEPYCYIDRGYIAPSSKNKVNYITVDLTNGTDLELFATWEWKDTKQTDHFEITWEYDTGNAVWFNGSHSELAANVRISSYNAPSNAKRVRVKILPVSLKYTTKTQNGTSFGTYTTAYWVGQWSSYVYYKFLAANTPAKPSVPTVSMEQYTLTAEVNSYDENTQYIEFEVVKNDQKTIASGQSKVITNHAAFSTTVAIGGQYKVRARGLLPVAKTPKVTNQVKTTVGNCEAGEWSEYSSNITTVPKAPAKIKSHTVLTSTSVQLNWDLVTAATGYTVEYAKDKMFFDSSSEPQSQSVENASTMIITGLDTGTTWFFRLKATNEQGSSGWTPVYSITIGVKPSPPTTWSETSTVIIGEKAKLFWMHNAEDGSSQRAAQVVVTINGAQTVINSPTHLATDGTASYTLIDTTSTSVLELATRSDDITLDSSNNIVQVTSMTNIIAGSVLQWKVRTKGVLDEWSDWSVVRSITAYQKPTIEMTVSDRSDLSTYIYTLQKYPFYVNGVGYPETQDVVGWNCSIISNEAYESRNQDGSVVYIKEGEEVFSKYYAASDREITITFGPETVDLETNITYTVLLSVIMNSGLTSEASKSFTVDWKYTDLEPNAEVSVDPELLTAYILPYCVDSNDDPIENVVLSVYRREYDGRFVEIASGIENGRSITVTDPHPALDYARYRIIAQSTETGLVDYYDIPGIPVGETSIIIQWDEDWSNYNYENGNALDPLSEPVHTGSMLRLPYNVSISDKYGMDVSHVEYIGRSHPVSYYGTQLGVTSSWSSDIPRDDAETLYALRRLAIYQGDAYVREPSGSGYWATVVPSFNKNYDSLTIPVTLDITRVEGGI